MKIGNGRRTILALIFVCVWLVITGLGLIVGKSIFDITYEIMDAFIFPINILINMAIVVSVLAIFLYSVYIVNKKFSKVEENLKVGLGLLIKIISICFFSLAVVSIAILGAIKFQQFIFSINNFSVGTCLFYVTLFWQVCIVSIGFLLKENVSKLIRIIKYGI